MNRFNVPKDALTEYVKRTAFLKGIIQTASLITPVEKVSLAYFGSLSSEHFKLKFKKSLSLQNLFVYYRCKVFSVLCFHHLSALIPHYVGSPHCHFLSPTISVIFAVNPFLPLSSFMQFIYLFFGLPPVVCPYPSTFILNIFLVLVLTK